MQMNDKILTALEVLKDAAENDFERHRIDVLIKDLTDPPKVEVIDDKQQKFNGVVYRENTHAYFRTQQSIHQSVYRYYCGEIPIGYEVHHKNGKKNDNNISNLQLLSKEQHGKLHSIHVIPFNFLKLQKFVCQNCGKEFEKPNVGTNKFCTPKCRQIYFSKLPHITASCEYCGKIFKTHKKTQRFCSNECAAKEKSKNHSEIRICPNCGKNFIVSQSVRKVYCSNDCACEAKEKNYVKIRQCAFCGKEFHSLSHKAKYCSKNCANKASRERKSFS